MTNYTCVDHYSGVVFLFVLALTYWKANMLKLLILLPFLAFAGLFGATLLLPLLAIALVIALPLLILRVLIGVFFGFGALIVGAFGFGLGLGLAGMGLLLAFGVIAAHLALPVLIIVGLIWLIRRAARPPPPYVERRSA